MLHVSLLHKCLGDLSQVIQFKDIEFEDSLAYEECSIWNMDKQIKTLRCRQILLVKVYWQNHQTEEAIYEIEEDTRQKYSQLFE